LLKSASSAAIFLCSLEIEDEKYPGGIIMKNTIMNLISNIKSDANREAKVLKAVAKTMPELECPRTYQSYDKHENIITKELHVEFSYLGTDCEFYTTADSKWKVIANGEYLATFWWDASTGRLSMCRRHEKPISKVEAHIIDKLLEVVIKTSQLNEKRWALPKEIRYGKYIVFPCNAEIICKDTKTDKSWRVFNTEYGMIGWDTEFPADIKRMLESNFLRK
jgi:hypothetical protein